MTRGSMYFRGRWPALLAIFFSLALAAPGFVPTHGAMRSGAPDSAPGQDIHGGVAALREPLAFAAPAPARGSLPAPATLPVMYSSKASTLFVRNDTTVPGVSGGVSCPVPDETIPVGRLLYVACPLYPYLLKFNTSSRLVSSTVSSGDAFQGGMTYDPVGNTIFEGDSNWSGSGPSGTVGVYNLTTGRFDSRINGMNPYPNALAYDPANRIVYAALELVGSLAIIDAARRTLLGVDTGVGSVVALSVDPNLGRLYLADSSGTQLRILNTTSGAFLAPVNVGFHPGTVRYDPLNHLTYVGNGGGANVTVVNATTLKVVGTIAVGSGPTSIAVDTRTGELFVANGGSGNVSVINGTTNKVVGSVSVGSFPSAVTFDPISDAVYETDRTNGSLAKIDPATLHAVWTERLGAQPGAVLFDAPRGRLYLGDLNRPGLAVFNATNNRLIRMVGTPGVVDALALDSSGGRLFVSEGAQAESNLSVIDTANLTVRAVVPLPSPANAVAFDPVHNVIFANLVDNVSVISGSTYQVLAKIPVGGGGSAMACDPRTGIAYVATYGNQSNGYQLEVDEISGGSIRLVGHVPTPSEPYQALFDPAIGSVLISDNLHQIEVLNVTRNSLDPPITLAGHSPFSIAYQSTTHVLFATDGIGHVWAYPSTSSGVPYNLSITWGSAVYGNLAIDPNTDTLYTTDVVNGTVLILTLGPAVAGMAVTPSVVPLGAMVTLAPRTVLGVPPYHFSYVGLPPGCPTADAPSLACYPTVAGTYLVRGSVSDRSTLSTNVSATVTVVLAPRYAVSFTETGLPSGTAWTVNLSGSTQGGTTNVITYQMPNGTYPFHILGVGGWTASAFSGSVRVDGAAVPVTVAWTRVTYAVSVSESGLPSAVEWWINISGIASTSSHSTSLSFPAPNGTYDYSVSTTDKTYASYGGRLAVDGSTLSTAVVFSRVLNLVIFLGFGLPSSLDRNWSVTIDGRVLSSHAGPDCPQPAPASCVMGFLLANGTYGFTVTAPGGFAATPVSGSVVVEGTKVVQDVTFAPLAGSPTSPRLAAGEGYLLAGGIAVAAVAVAVALAITRRKSPPSRPREAAPRSSGG